MSVRRAPYMGACLAFAAFQPATAWAHAFDRRYDLPAPLSYFVAGAAVAVGLSFLIAALFARGTPAAAQAASSRIVQAPWLPGLGLISRVVACVLFALVVGAGLFGDGDPMTNIAPTLTWIVWWVGLPLVVACIGNIWPAIDPWQTLFGVLDWVARRWRNQIGIGARWTYPQALGQWPAVVLLLSIAWLELIYSQAAIPFNIACIALGWSALTLSGMACFGREAWLRNADVFSVYFDILGRFAPLAAGPGPREIEMRPPGRDLIAAGPGSTAKTAFIVAMLSTVLFDGLFNGQLWRQIMREVSRTVPQLIDGYVLGSAGLAGLWLIFLAAYLLSCRITTGLARGGAALAVANRFAPTLVPIAVAYGIAHNFSMLVIQGLDLVRLLSDPLGMGWDLFGTAKFTPAIGIIDARMAWYIALISIVAGHVISIWIAHRLALREFGTPRRAVMACIPLTVLMVFYTAVSLSVIAEPMVKFDPTR